VASHQWEHRSHKALNETGGRATTGRAASVAIKDAEADDDATACGVRGAGDRAQPLTKRGLRRGGDGCVRAFACFLVRGRSKGGGGRALQLKQHIGVVDAN
jgi:hypothetical protein